MRRRFITYLIATFGLIARSEVHYFATDTAAVPSGEIAAVEVRAANASARVGEAKLAGWQLSWPGVDISLTFDYRNFVDGVSENFATLRCNDATVEIRKELNTNGEFNTVAIEWHLDGRTLILVGEHKLKEVLTTKLPKPEGKISVTGISGDVIIQDLIIETNSDSFGRLLKYASAELAGAKRWEYLDRTNDPKTAIVGGQYVLAQIGNDLVYLSGAKTNGEHWQPGMVKGHLIPTGFDGYYKLQWYDATGRKMPGENFAEHDASLGVMKLSFPELGATIRLRLANEQ